jgi:hypothetical protein
MLETSACGDGLGHSEQFQAEKRPGSILQSMRRLPKILTPLETWGFGLTTHSAWFFTLP